MERFVKGDVVVTLFPYSDFSKTKRRPALIKVGSFTLEKVEEVIKKLVEILEQ